MLAGNRNTSGKRERPAAFICHDSRDKERVARPIAEGLSRLACPVWYDEFSLDVGELIQRRNIILPVWAGVTTKSVLAYSPSLANRVAVNWRLGIDEVVRRLYCAIEDG